MHWVLTGGSVVLSSLQLSSQWLLRRHHRAGWMVTMVANVVAVPYELYTSQYGFLAVCALGWVNALAAWRAWSPRYNVETTAAHRPHASQGGNAVTSPQPPMCASALQDLVRLSEELGLYEATQMQVCTTHQRVLCCRRGTQDSPCTWSQDPADIATVTGWQQGNQ